jgi:subtilisin family serine protease
VVNLLVKPARALGVLLLAFALLVPAAMPDAVEAKKSEPRQRGSGSERGALIVKFRAGVSDADAIALGNSAGASEIGRIDEINARVLKVTGRDRKKVRQQLASNPAVLSVEDDGEAHAVAVPTDPLWSAQWYARTVRAPAAWDITTGASETIVAVIDTGVQANHPDLKGRVLAGWNFVGNNANAEDDGDHGTPASGIIAAAGNNGVGVAGMCWKCRILPVKVLNSSGGGTWSNISAGIIWAANNGASVINLSLGGASSSSALRDAIDYAVAKDIVVVAAAGNNGSTSKFYPAAYPGVISVAATTSSDGIYNFSNRGSWVRIAAPGCTHSSSIGSTWRSFCGTSAAAPVVAGIAALVRSRAPHASKSQVENALLSTTVAIGTVIGGGRVDALGSLHAAAPLASLPKPTPSPTPKPTPSPTPKPTPSPTPKPTPSPTPTPTPPPPTVPKGLTGVAGSKFVIRLSWQASSSSVAGPIEYRVWRDGAAIGTKQTTLTYVDSQSGVGSFTYRVRAIDSAGRRSVLSPPITLSSVASVLPSATGPSVPEGLKAVAGKKFAIRLEWQASTSSANESIRYRVFRNGRAIATKQTGLTLVDQRKKVNTFTYQVRAIDAAGRKSDLSPPIKVTSRP